MAEIGLNSDVHRKIHPLKRDSRGAKLLLHKVDGSCNKDKQAEPKTKIQLDERRKEKLGNVHICTSPIFAIHQPVAMAGEKQPDA